MKKLTIIAMVFLLCAFTFASYNENFTVLVTDEELRPVPNAAVTVTYQLSSLKGYFTSIPKYTNAQGRVPFILTNTEFLADRTRYDFTVNATYGNELASSQYTVGRHADPIVLQLKVYYLNLYVLDEHNNPLHANVTFLNQTYETDANGYVLLRAPYGMNSVSVEYAGATDVHTVNVTTHGKAEVHFSFYEVKFLVTDENASALLATVNIGDLVQNTGTDGTTVFKDLRQGSIAYQVHYQNRTKEGTANLAGQYFTPEITVRFDLMPPEISDVALSTDAAGTIFVTAAIEDFGPYASGLDPSGVSFRYYVSGQETEVPLYVISKGVYKAEIPPQAAGTVIDFVIIAQDREGNRKVYSDRYQIKENVTDPCVANPGLPQCVAPPKPECSTDSDCPGGNACQVGKCVAQACSLPFICNLNLLHVALLIVGVILLVVVAVFLKNKLLPKED